MLVEIKLQRKLFINNMTDRIHTLNLGDATKSGVLGLCGISFGNGMGDQALAEVLHLHRLYTQTLIDRIDEVSRFGKDPEITAKVVQSLAG
jgi:hypothetical protein